MKKVKITAVRKACYPDLMAQYENPIEHTCDVEEGMVWISENGEKPKNFCDSAWESVASFVKTLLFNSLQEELAIQPHSW